MYCQLGRGYVMQFAIKNSCNYSLLKRGRRTLFLFILADGQMDIGPAHRWCVDLINGDVAYLKQCKGGRYSTSLTITVNGTSFINRTDQSYKPRLGFETSLD